VKRVIIGSAVLVVVGVAAVVGVTAQRRAAAEAVEYGWEDCTGPFVEGVPTLADFGPEIWEGSPLRLEPFTDVGEAVITQAIDETGEGFFLTAQAGMVFRVDASGTAEPVLDLSNEVLVGDEQGLLSVAVHPDGSYLYVTFTDQQGTVHLDEFSLPGFGNRRDVLTLAQPQKWHNGGHIAFGPDGYLYATLGDGGGLGDPFRNGQDPGNLYGTMIRIDPHPVDSAAPYLIPADNPYVDDRDIKDEIWAWGLRNAWRFSFDRVTGDIWLGDVGQNCVEEVDVIPAGAREGANFGWSNLEGSQRVRGTIPEDAVLPLFEYSHLNGGCSITGGYVYRGDGIPELGGMYLFADYCRGEVMALELDAAGRPAAVWKLGVKANLLTSFSEGPDGEIYVLTKDQGVLKLVLR